MSTEEYVLSLNPRVVWGERAEFRAQHRLDAWHLRSFTPRDLFVNVRAAGIVRLTRLRMGDLTLDLAEKWQDGVHYSPVNPRRHDVPPILWGKVLRGQYLEVEGGWSDLVDTGFQRGSPFLLAIDLVGTAELQ